MDRLFLDANVLFSAAWHKNAGVAGLGSLDAVVLSTSSYAVEEADRNLPTQEQKRRLERLLRAVQVVESATVSESARSGVVLPEKDWPIVAGAIASGSTFLITGDVQHFGRYFGKKIAGILVLRPAKYLRRASRARS